MTEIKDGVFAQVAGTVEKTFTAKNGPVVVVAIARQGAQYPDRVTVWEAPAEIVQGDRVSLKGWLSWRKTEKDGKTYVDVALNKPQVVAHEPQEPVSQADDGSGWPASEVPF